MGGKATMFSLAEIIAINLKVKVAMTRCQVEMAMII